MKKNLTAPILFCLFQILLFSLNTFAQSDIGNIYVWEFATRDGERNDFTQSLTEEFEEALIQSQCCEILQRRIYSRLIDQKRSEKAVMKLDGAPESAISNLKSLEANVVVFGELYDDSNSGKVKVTINFESFDGRILKKASTYLAKYDLANPEKREQAVKTIMEELNIFDSPGKILETKTLGEWELSLTECRRLGSDVICGLKVTSKYRDRNFIINVSYSTAQDEYSYDYNASLVKIANNEVTGGSLVKLLTAGNSATGQITFPNISKRATRFPLLSIYVEGDDLIGQHIQFRDIKIN